MALDRKIEFFGGHALAVVDDLDQRAAAVLQRDVDAPGPGVDGIFHQLLDCGGRPLDDLAGGDAVDDVGWEQTNRHA